MPFGLNENNTLVHIADVENGKKCACICPCCRVPLIAANKGKVRQHHFKHDFGSDCEGGLESAIHLAAKQIIKEKRQITLPEYIASISGTDSRGMQLKEQETVVRAGKVALFDSAEDEIELHEMKADILAKTGDTPLMIEIYYRHKVDDQKVTKMRNANISALEIDLSDLKAEDVTNWESFWSRINDPKRVKWLHNAKAHTSVRKMLEARLKKSIQEQEQYYQDEEVKKQKQELREKQRLIQALNDLQILCTDREYVERLKREAETHPVWKRTSQYLGYAWQELPDFLNVDVPDGDWIFGCDRRVWQTAFYSYFIGKNKKPFSVRAIDSWLQNTVGCKVPLCAETVGILGRKYPQLVPANISGNLPSSWRTLRVYLKNLCELGLLEYSGDDRKFPGSCWYKVVSQDAQSEIRIKYEVLGTEVYLQGIPKPNISY